MALFDFTGAFPDQDYITLGGMSSPGKATVTAGDFVAKYDVAEGYGQSGGSTIYHGDTIKHAEVTIELWLPEHFAQWEVFSRTILFKKPIRGTAITVHHPVLKAIQFIECQVEAVSAFQDDGTGLWSCSIKLLEFRRPKAMLSKALVAIPGVPKPKPPVAVDAAEVEIQQLSAELARVK